ncbi:MAG: V-type ATP synthase subunit C [Peptoniphilaceae bacterium]|nr:V-type ATP synthase subunit C [Peptoniphilaceae bacterium]MDY3738648.1 V-type ATP synthase subunit C [Peptoniphilaceae bacterium]
MDRNKFIQASTTTRVYEKNLLNNNQLESMADAKNLHEALISLSDSIYHEEISKLSRDEDYEIVLDREIHRVYRQIQDISPDKRIIDFLKLKYIYHNLKVLVKEIILDENLNEIYEDFYDDINYIELKKNLKVQNGEGIFYQDALEAIKSYEESKDPQAIDFTIDKKYYKRLLEISKDMKEDFFINFTKNTIDFINIKSLLRAKIQNKDFSFLENILIDGGFIEKSEYPIYLTKDLNADCAIFKKSHVYDYIKKAFRENLNDTLMSLEKAIDDYQTDLLIKTKKETYGPEILFGYVVAKETEIKNLRVIFVSKLNRLDSEFIKGKLRKSYV